MTSLVPMTTEQAKAWLSRYAESEQELDGTLERIRSLRASLEAPGSAIITGMPHGTAEADRIGAGLARIEALEALAQRQLERSRLLYAEISTAAGSLTGKDWPNAKAILQMHYLDGATWAEINTMLWWRKADFLERTESYLRRTFRIFNDAVEQMTLIIPEIQGNTKGGKNGERTHEGLEQNRGADDPARGFGSSGEAD